MKTLLKSFFYCCFFSMFAFAAKADNPCLFDKNLLPADLEGVIIKDLLDGNWTNANNSELTFFKNNLVLDHSPNVAGNPAQPLRWTIFSTYEYIYVTLHRGETKDHYRVNMECDGFQLVSTEGDTLTKEIPTRNREKASLVQRTLQGTWSIYTRLEDKKASIECAFFANGTYQISWERRGKQSQETGTYTLSQGGNFIILEGNKGNNRVAKINHLDWEGMTVVLDLDHELVKGDVPSTLSFVR